MASLEINLSDLATAIATKVKLNRTLLNGNMLDLSALHTTAKDNLVNALNEISDAVSAASGIDDDTTSGASTWSSSKIDSEISAAEGSLQDEIDTKAEIDDTTPGDTAAYSSNKIIALIAAAKSEIMGGTPAAELDTIKELADALASDDSAIAAINTALANRVRTDTNAQGLNDTAKSNARTNIAAAAAADLDTTNSDLAALTAAVGDTGADLVAVFEAGLT